MKRRNFLKYLSSIPLIGIPVRVLAKIEPVITHNDTFDPYSVQENKVYLDRFVSELSVQERNEIFSCIKKDMESIIPPEYRHKVTYPSGLEDHSLAPFDPYSDIVTWKWLYTP